MVFDEMELQSIPPIVTSAVRYPSVPLGLTVHELSCFATDSRSRFDSSANFSAISCLIKISMTRLGKRVDNIEFNCFCGLLTRAAFKCSKD